MRIAPASYGSLSGPTPGDATRAGADRPWTMAEVSPPRAVDPAAQSVRRPPTDNPKRISASVSFRSLLLKPPAGLVSAHGPVVRHAHPQIAQSRPEPAPDHPQTRPRRGPEDAPDPEPDRLPEAALDPLFCQLAMNQAQTLSVQLNPASSLAPSALPLRGDLQHLLNGLARRTAWGGDRRKGSARIELSEGALAGATLVVHAEQRSVSVELELPQGLSAPGWQQRIADRLEARGFSARVQVG